MYIVHCILCVVHYALYIVHCTLYIARWTQMKSPKKRDWENTIIEKLQHLKILMTIQEIGAMPKATYKKIIKE